MNYTLVFFLLLSTNIFSQTDSSFIKLLARSKGNSIQLRWGINDAYLWQRALDDGFKLSRSEYKEGLKYQEYIFSDVIKNPIKKWDKKIWEEYASAHKNIQDDSIKYAHVAWEIVKENIYLQGGEPFEEMMKYRNALKSKHSYGHISADQSWTGAVLQGLGYEDTSIESGKSYIYKLSFAFDDPNYNMSPAYVIVNTNESKKNERYEVKVKELDKTINLQWSKAIESSGFYIEVSSDGKNYIKDNRIPYYQLVSGDESGSDSTFYIVDSLVNDKMYHFRVKGKNPFGESFVIGEVKGTPRDLTPPRSPIIVNVKHIEEQKASIKWEMIEPLDEDLQGFIIGRSNDPFGIYEQIHDGLVPKERREFYDIYFNKDSETYYIIEAVDRNDNRSRSNFGHLALVDSVAPDPPIHIKSKMDSTGIVTIQLQPQKEKDFMGFRIYKANAEDHEFSVVQETYNDTIVVNARNPVIIDTSTVESLTKYIYYKVTALDYHYNESKFSALMKVPRPDKIPPVPPLINDYVTTDKEIRLSITASSSSDVRQNFLYRKKDTDKEWLLLDSLGIKNAAYSDQTTENNVFYLYTVRAIDDSGLKSEFGNVIRIRTYYKPRPLDMTMFCTYFTADKQTMVTWKLNEQIKEEIAFEMYDLTSNVEKNIGRASPATPDIFVFKTDKSPEIIGIKAYTETKEYLISVGPACIISKAKIEEDERFKKYKNNLINK